MAQAHEPLRGVLHGFPCAPSAIRVASCPKLCRKARHNNTSWSCYRSYIHTNIHKHMCIYMYVYTYIYIYAIYIYILTYTYLCMPWQNGLFGCGTYWSFRFLVSMESHLSFFRTIIHMICLLLSEIYMNKSEIKVQRRHSDVCSKDDLACSLGVGFRVQGLVCRALGLRV